MNLNDILKLLESHRSDKQKVNLIKSGQKKTTELGYQYSETKGYWPANRKQP